MVLYHSSSWYKFVCVCTYILTYMRSVQSQRLTWFIKSECCNIKSPVCVWLNITCFWMWQWSTQNCLARKGFYKWPLPRLTIPSTELFSINKYLYFIQSITVYKHSPQHFPEYCRYCRYQWKIWLKGCHHLN